MKRLLRYSIPFLILSIALMTAVLQHTAHAEEDAITTSITVHQKSVITEVLGDWSISYPDNTKKISEAELSTIDSINPGRYSFFVNPPEGASISITLFRNGFEEQHVEVPQVTFELEENDSILLLTSFNFPRRGDAIVTSDPLGLSFVLNGPHGSKEGVTPEFYEGLPIGQYSVDYEKIEDCSYPPVQSQRILENGRADFQLTLHCDKADDMRQEYQHETLPDYVTIRVDGKDVSFHDVPVSAWYAPFVKIAADHEIMNGSKDSNGKLTGEFNPGGKVTIAQLAKIAHEVAGVNERDYVGEPRNERAQNQWFSRYYLSAEKRGWLVFTDPQVIPGRFATRAEVITTLMQAFTIPRIWPTGEVFTDVTNRTLYASSIETAANEGLIEGTKDKDGNFTGRFAPSQHISRAEISKIIAKAIELYILDEEHS